MYFTTIEKGVEPGWCGSVDWVLACKLKGRWFDSQSGHMPGLWARSPVRGVWGDALMFLSLSLSPSLTLSLKVNKILYKNKEGASYTKSVQRRCFKAQPFVLSLNRIHRRHWKYWFLWQCRSLRSRITPLLIPFLFLCSLNTYYR